MIEIVFSESAYGSLQIAQSYGVGEYHGGASSVFICKSDGSHPTQEELRQAQREAEEKARRDWENAIPLGSKRSDIYCFDIALSVGEITEPEIGSQRKAVLETLHTICPMENITQQLDKKLQSTRNSLTSVLKRCAAGEAIRIWYSHNPDEMCGMYWLLAQLRHIKQRGTVYLVKLPEWEYTDESTVTMHSGWGEIGPSEWGRYQSLQQEVLPALFAFCSTKWGQLKKENAPLRVYLNGQLQSAQEDIYDCFILREIDKQPEVFAEAAVIGNILGAYQLGIGDAWIAIRIEKMITTGKLEIVEGAPADDLLYRQKLRKVVAQ